MNKEIILGMMFGTFMGNLISYSYVGYPIRGLAVGIIAAILVPIFFSIIDWLLRRYWP